MANSFRCSHCLKTYTRQSSLNRHTSVKHSAPAPLDFSCGECGKAFSRKDVFERHRRQHNGKVNEACPYCSRTYRKDYLGKHFESCELSLEHVAGAIVGGDGSGSSEDEGYTRAQGTSAVAALVRRLRWQPPVYEPSLRNNYSTEQNPEVSTPRRVKQPVTFVIERPYSHTKSERRLARRIYRTVSDGKLENLKVLRKKAKDLGLSIKQLDGVFKADFRWNTKRKSMLMIGAEGGHPDILDFMIKQDVDHEDRDDGGQTALHWACSSGSIACVRVLLDNGADVNAMDNILGNTPLHCAAREGHEGVVSLLLDRGADTEARALHHSTGYNTPLGIALMSDKTAVAALLVGRGANLVTQDDTGAVALHKAVEVGDSDLVNLVLDSGSERDPVNAKGETPLCTATKASNSAAVNVLLARGVAVNGAGLEGSPTPLLLSCRNGDALIVQTLLGADADVKLGIPTPLGEAVRQCHAHVVQVLLQNSATSEHVPEELRLGLDSLTFAPVYGPDTTCELHWHIVERIMNIVTNVSACWYKINDLEDQLKRGVANGLLIGTIDTLCGRRWGSCLISLACRHEAVDREDHVEMLKYLIPLGLDVDAKGADGWTALQHASQKGNLVVMQLLLEAGADMHLTTSTLLPRSSLELAFQAGSESVMLLLKIGQHFKFTILDYRTKVFTLACSHDYVDVAQCLLDGEVNDPSGLFKFRASAMSSAVISGSARMVQVVLGAGATPYMLPNDVYETLHACANGRSADSSASTYDEAELKLYILSQHLDLVIPR